MAIPNLANGWASTLAWSLTDVATTVDVASTSGIPSRPFQAVILAEGANADEIVTVTDLTGSEITITRAVEANAAGSTSASAHGSGAVIAHVLTKATLTELVGAGVNTVASSGSAQTVDVATASVWDVTLDANCAITIAGSSSLVWLSGPDVSAVASSTTVIVFTTTTAAGYEQTLELRLHQDGTGGRTVTFSDDGGGTVFYGAQAGGNTGSMLQVGSATRTAGDVTTTSTSFVDLTGMSVTLTTGAHRCLVIFSGTGNTSASASNIYVDLAIDGTRVGQTLGLQFGSSERTTPYGINHPLGFTYLTAVLSAASHTFKIQWAVGAGTGTMYASTTVTPIIMTVIETGLTA